MKQLFFGAVTYALVTVPLFAQFTISKPIPVQLNSITVAITWTSSVPTSGFIFFAKDDNSQGWPNEVEDPQPLKTTHNVNIPVENGHTYYYVIDQNDASSNNLRSAEYSFVAGSISSVGTSIRQPERFQLDQNFPNPCNPGTMISFTLPEDGYVSLKVFDAVGREVRTLIDGKCNAGEVHRVTFNASTLSSGIYFYRLQSTNGSLTKKLILAK